LLPSFRLSASEIPSGILQILQDPLQIRSEDARIPFSSRSSLSARIRSYQPRAEPLDRVIGPEPALPDTFSASRFAVRIEIARGTLINSKLGENLRVDGVLRGAPRRIRYEENPRVSSSHTPPSPRPAAARRGEDVSELARSRGKRSRGFLAGERNSRRIVFTGTLRPRNDSSRVIFQVSAAPVGSRGRARYEGGRVRPRGCSSVRRVFDSVAIAE